MDRGGAGFGDPQRLQRGDGAVDGREVALHHRASAAAVGRLDGGLDLRDRIGARNHARQIEEAGLHHGVDAFTQAGSVCDGSGVDHPDRQLTLDDQIADLGGQLVPGAVAVGRVEQHGGTGLGQIESAHLEKQLELVHRDEVGPVDEIGRVDRLLTEAQMADGGCSRLAGVVDEVALRVASRIRSDDLDGVLGRTDGAVRTQTEEDRRERVGRGAEIGRYRQRKMRHVVVDADREAPLGLVGGQFGEHGGRHRRGVLLARQAVASADDRRHAGVEAGGILRGGNHHIGEQRLAGSTGFLGAVEHRDRGGGGRQCGDQLGGRERTIEP